VTGFYVLVKETSDLIRGWGFLEQLDACWLSQKRIIFKTIFCLCSTET